MESLKRNLVFHDFWKLVYLNQRPDQYKMKILVFSIQYDFKILKYQYEYSIWRILNKYQYQYAKKLKYQYSVSVSFQEKSVKKWANQADLTNWGEIKFVLKYKWFIKLYHEKQPKAQMKPILANSFNQNESKLF